MPELPEVETVRRGLAPAMEGAAIDNVLLNREGLRFPFPDQFAGRLQDRKIISLGRRAKYLLADLDDGMVLVMHLGMSGSFRVEEAATCASPGEFVHPRSENPKHDHVIIELRGEDAGARVIYNDPRRFGFMDLIERATLNEHPFFCQLGMEPTGNELDGTAIARMMAGKKAPLKAALLDQRLIAGLGNIYVCEALWRSKLSPKRMAGTITTKAGNATERAERLAQHIRAVIAEAIEAGGSSLRDHRQTDGSLGYFQHRFDVYGREGEPCRSGVCGGTISRTVQSGRSTFYCPKCQR